MMAHADKTGDGRRASAWDVVLTIAAAIAAAVVAVFLGWVLVRNEQGSIAAGQLPEELAGMSYEATGTASREDGQAAKRTYRLSFTGTDEATLDTWEGGAEEDGGATATCTYSLGYLCTDGGTASYLVTLTDADSGKPAADRVHEFVLEVDGGGVEGAGLWPVHVSVAGAVAALVVGVVVLALCLGTLVGRVRQHMPRERA